MEIEKFKLNNRTWQTTQSFLPMLLDILPKLKTVKMNHIRRHRRTAFINTKHNKYFIKMYLVRKSRIRQAIEFATKQTRAFEEWTNHIDVWKKGLPVPEPLAFSEYLPYNLKYTSLFIMQAMDSNFVSLREFTSESDPVSKHHAYHKAAEYLASMHDQGIYHLDYTDANVFGKVTDDRWQPQMFIDFEKYRSGTAEDDQLAFASLARASKKLKTFSNLEAFRLLKYYLKARGIASNKPRLAKYIKWLNEIGHMSPNAYAKRSIERRQHKK